MRDSRRQAIGLKYCFCILAALTSSSYQSVYAAESNKIHIVETKYGDFMEDKTCAPDVKRCEGTAKCVVEATDSLCKTGAKPAETRLQVIWDCGEHKHAGDAARGKKVTLTCPYVPNLN